MKHQTELPNQEIIRTVNRKEIYKYFAILEVDASNQKEIRKKQAKNPSEGQKIRNQTLQQKFSIHFTISNVFRILLKLDKR